MRKIDHFKGSTRAKEVDTLATTLHIAKQIIGEALVSRVERNGAWCLCLGLELGLELGLGKLDSGELASPLMH